LRRNCCDDTRNDGEKRELGYLQCQEKQQHNNHDKSNHEKIIKIIFSWFDIGTMSQLVVVVVTATGWQGQLGLQNKDANEDGASTSAKLVNIQHEYTQSYCPDKTSTGDQTKFPVMQLLTETLRQKRRKSFLQFNNVNVPWNISKASHSSNRKRNDQVDDDNVQEATTASFHSGRPVPLYCCNV
jgi:hypothetical protein